ncbi:MAG: EFR1 family ferrodoxin [Paludibacteraceae bacterium]|nr:EFR1 family ferrodoxin [Paludibacteraceae bacterium]
MSGYSHLTVYYFSGTGNAKNVALWLSESAKKANVSVDVIAIADVNRRSITPPVEGSLVAFVSPVHGFNYPPVMLHFIAHFPKGRYSVLLLNTRAGMLLGRFITPGVSGISLYLSALILKLKGHRIQALFPVDLPSNWISLHPGLNPKTVDYIYTHIQPRVIEFAQTALAGKSDFKSVRECVVDLLVAPIAVLYYVAGRFMIAKTFYASRDCNKCGLCVRNCPVQAIRMVDNRPYWKFSCESCMRCMNSCPKRAIETAHGMFVVLAVAFSFLLSAVIYQQNNMAFVAHNSVLQFLFETVLFLSLVAIWYRLFHFLLRYRWFERLVVYTSLTKFKFWNRYKGWHQ